MQDLPTAAPNPQNSDLTEEDVKNLTSQLSQEIDQEIKKQFAENQALEKTQDKVDQLLNEKEAEKEPVKEPTAPESRFEKPKFTPSPELENLKEDPAPISLDPLHSSILAALGNLQEGDHVSKDWVLKKILTTSFGNNKSSFYELENSSGAHWTLSPEEMKDVLRTEILSKKEKEEEQKQNSTEKMAAADAPEKILAPRRDDETIIEPAKKENNDPEKTSDEGKEKVLFEPQEKQAESDNLNLTKKQIELVNKLHADKNLWEIFTTFSPDVWEKVYQMYLKGKLTEIGIDAHPLLDQIDNSNLGKTVDIAKGTPATKLLTDNGYQLTWTTEDALILGCHILANYDVINEAIKKVEELGIAVSSLQPKKNIIELIIKAKSGDPSSLSNLQEDLRFLPVNGKFKIIKPEELEPLKKFI